MAITPAIKTVGFIGLGNVGAKLAGSLLIGGHDLIVHDLDREAAAPLLEKGARWAESPAEVAAQCDLAITCLPHPAASRRGGRRPRRVAQRASGPDRCGWR